MGTTWRFWNVGNSRKEDTAPDVAMYPEEREGFWDDGDKDKEDERKMWDAHMSYAWIAVMIECKWNHDPAFGFPTKDGKQRTFLPPHPKAIHARSQHFKHAAEILRSQHRHHLFSVYVVKQAARLIYFDRAGMVVSKPLDLTQREGKQRLCEFIYALAHMQNRFQLGYDPTMQVATQQDICNIPKKFKNEYFRQCRTEMMVETSRFPIYKVSLLIVSFSSSPTIAAGLVRRRRRPRESFHISHRQASLESLLGVRPWHKGIHRLRCHQ